MNTDFHRLLFCMLGAFLCLSKLQADQPPFRGPIVFTPKHATNVFFCMTPEQRDERYNITKQAHGIAYKLTAEGNLVELYRTEDWYSSEIFLSYEGDYIVRMHSWIIADKPKKEHVALAFYKNGKELKSYSTVELLKNTKKIENTASGYHWLAEHRTEEGTTFYANLDDIYDNVFTIRTIDGWTYIFDYTTGKIQTEQKTSKLKK